MPEHKEIFPRNNEKKLKHFTKIAKSIAKIMIGLSLSVGLVSAQDNEEHPDIPRTVSSSSETITSREEFIQQVRDIRSQHGEIDDTIDLVVLGDSVGATDRFLAEEDLSGLPIAVTNWSYRGGSYLWPQEHSSAFDVIANINSLPKKPDFVMFLFGRNDCSFVDTTRAVAQLNEYRATGLLPTDASDGSRWFSNIIKMIDALEEQGIVPIIVTNTPVTRVNYCRANERHISRVLAAVAEAKSVPVLTLSDTQYVTTGSTHPMIYAQDIIPRDLVAANDGVHLPLGRYHQVNNFIASSLEQIDMVTNPGTPLQPNKRFESNPTTQQEINTVQLSESLRNQIRQQFSSTGQLTAGDYLRRRSKKSSARGRNNFSSW